MAETSLQFKSKIGECDTAKKKRTALTRICHHTLKCQRKAIMCIRKMQALRNEMPEQKKKKNHMMDFSVRFYLMFQRAEHRRRAELGIAETRRHGLRD